MTQRTDSHLIFRDFKRSYPEIVRGEGIYLYDHNGKKYLDGTSGSAAVCNLGHGVAEISRAVKTLSLSIFTFFLDLIASSRGTAFMSGVARATI